MKVLKACQSKVGGGAKRASTVTAGEGGVAGSREKPFDTMNNIVANLLLNLTRSIGILVEGHSRTALIRTP